MPWNYFREEFCNIGLGYDSFLHSKNPIFFLFNFPSPHHDFSNPPRFFLEVYWPTQSSNVGDGAQMLQFPTHYAIPPSSSNMAIILLKRYFHRYIFHYNLFFLAFTPLPLQAQH
jgi:hypothetical protein